MHRRTFLEGAAGSMAALEIGGSKAWGDQGAQIIWMVPRAQVSMVRETLNFNGTVTADPASPDTKGLPLLFILVGVAALPSLANALAGACRDIRYGGVIVTEKDGKLEINNDTRLGGGTLIVKDKDGTHVYQSPKGGPDTGELLKALISIATKKPTG